MESEVMWTWITVFQGSVCFCSTADHTTAVRWVVLDTWDHFSPWWKWINGLG